MLGVFFYGANNASLLVVVADLERKYEVLEKYGIDLTENGKARKIRPCHRS